MSLILFGFVALAAATSLYETGDLNIASSIGSCDENPYLYVMGYIPTKDQLQIQNFSNECPTLNGGLSCCTGDFFDYSVKWRENMSLLVEMIDDAIYGINQANLGLQTNLNENGVQSILNLVKHFGNIDPEKCYMTPDNCGPTLTNGILNLDGQHPECLNNFFTTFALKAVFTKDGRNQLTQLLKALSDAYDEWKAVVDGLMKTIREYSDVVVCAACQSSYVSHNAFTNFAYTILSEETVTEFREVIAGMQEPTIRFIKTLLPYVINIAEISANSCGIKADLQDNIDTILSVIQIPEDEVWTLLKALVSEFVDAIQMYLGTAAMPVFEQYGVTPALGKTFRKWSDDCARKSLVYSLGGVVTRSDKGVNIGMSISGTTFEIAAGLYGLKNGADKTCYNEKSEFMNWLAPIIAKVIDGTPFDRVNVYWGSDEVMEYVEEQGRIDQNDYENAQGIPIWRALGEKPSDKEYAPVTVTTHIEPSSKHKYGVTPYQVADKEWLSGYGQLDTRTESQKQSETVSENWEIFFKQLEAMKKPQSNQSTTTQPEKPSTEESTTKALSYGEQLANMDTMIALIICGVVALAGLIAVAVVMKKTRLFGCVKKKAAEDEDDEEDGGEGEYDYTYEYQYEYADECATQTQQ